MNLIGEEFVPPKQEKTKKTSKMLLIAIAVVFVLIVIIIILISSLKTEPLKVTLDGASNSDVKALLKFEEEGVYVPIKDIAPFLQYAAYSGDYTTKSEDNNKCYVEIDEEAAVFTAESDKIEKINKKTNESSYYDIDEPVQLIDGKLYTTPDGISKAFNVYFNYDVKKKKVTIQTLQYIINGYRDQAIKLGFDDISTDFNDSKAALDDLVIVKKSKSGLYNMNTEKEILEAKYDEIKYLPYTNEFLITSNGYKGIKDASGNDILKMQYEEIEQISNDLNLYVVKKDGKYGIVDNTEENIIPPVLDKIGMDIKKYAKNNVKNKYVLLDKFVPVMKNSKWALFTIEGKQLTNLKYESFGCPISNSTNSDALGVLVIPDYNMVVGLRDKKYYLIDENGKELGNGLGFDKIYMEIELDNTTYYVSRNGATAVAGKIIDRLLQMQNENNQQNNNNEQEENQQENEEEQQENHEQQENDEEQQENQEQEENEEENQEEQENEDNQDNEEQEE